MKQFIGIKRGGYDLLGLCPIDEEVHDFIVKKAFNASKATILSILNDEKSSMTNIGTIMTALDSHKGLDTLFSTSLSSIVDGMTTVYYDECEVKTASGEVVLRCNDRDRRANIEAYIKEVLEPLRDDKDVRAALSKVMKKFSEDVE